MYPLQRWGNLVERIACIFLLPKHILFKGNLSRPRPTFRCRCSRNLAVMYETAILYRCVAKIDMIKLKFGILRDICWYGRIQRFFLANHFFLRQRPTRASSASHCLRHLSPSQHSTAEGGERKTQFLSSFPPTKKIGTICIPNISPELCKLCFGLN